MVLFQKILLSKLIREGKSYSWSRPQCPRCHIKVWGHGYVLRFFNGFSTGVYLKRWRCQVCKLVITLRPEGYWRRFQETIHIIFESLKLRLRTGRWPPSVPRQRGGHWLRKLISHASVNLLKHDSILETVEFFQEKNLPIF
jgi:hypothetical protein